jgi:AmmeMemoRadiSam system protein A
MVDRVMLQIAKTVILKEFDPSIPFERESLLKKYPFLAQKGAVFVTLTKEGALRGCIGSIIAHTTLLDDLIHNAKAAAFNDPRFRPLGKEELDTAFVLEVSLLSEPELIYYSDIEDLIQKIEPKKDGLILKLGQYQGTFLPQVWEQLPTTELFLEQLSYKAGADPSIYERHPDLYRYRVEHIEDNWDAILPL